MSPEQAEGQLHRLGPQSDVYGLGSTLYTLICGVLAFPGEDVFDVIKDVRQGSFTRPRQIDPSIDPALEAICLKAMALLPENRYSTPKALGDDIERWMADEPVIAFSEPTVRRLAR
jgi:eukaryotic-like serine/threonine-protein kinase